MNILYIHGLDSKLSAEKRAVLEKHGKVISPDLNYYENEDTIAHIIKEVEHDDIDIVMGSSIGGFAGYYVSNALNRPALLFNPALHTRSVKQNVPLEIKKHNNLKQLIIGQEDDVVIPADTLGFLTDNFNHHTQLHLHLVPNLDHNIPVPFFELVVNDFFEKFVK